MGVIGGQCRSSRRNPGPFPGTTKFTLAAVGDTDAVFVTMLRSCNIYVDDRDLACKEMLGTTNMNLYIEVIKVLHFIINYPILLMASIPK